MIGIESKRRKVKKGNRDEYFQSNPFVLHFGSSLFHGRESFQFHGGDAIKEERHFQDEIWFHPLLYYILSLTSKIAIVWRWLKF
jgi:hypothetical protein